MVRERARDGHGRADGPGRFLAILTLEQWEPSFCERWRVRDVRMLRVDWADDAAANEAVVEGICAAAEAFLADGYAVNSCGRSPQRPVSPIRRSTCKSRIGPLAQAFVSPAASCLVPPGRMPGWADS